jgi:hypothetical protein
VQDPFASREALLKILLVDFGVLSVDDLISGRLKDATRTELDFFKDTLWHGRVLWGMMVYDSLKAMDYLVSRPDVDTQRLGTVGMSMGSSAAQWLGALDTRLKVVVDKGFGSSSAVLLDAALAAMVGVGSASEE